MWVNKIRCLLNAQNGYGFPWTHISGLLSRWSWVRVPPGAPLTISPKRKPRWRAPRLVQGSAREQWRLLSHCSKRAFPTGTPGQLPCWRARGAVRQPSGAHLPSRLSSYILRRPITGTRLRRGRDFVAACGEAASDAWREPADFSIIEGLPKG
jgi:hypothetical protein